MRFTERIAQIMKKILKGFFFPLHIPYQLLGHCGLTSYLVPAFFTVTAVNDVPAFSFHDLLPADKTKFFRYNGSLTTPTCLESVTWTVFRDHVFISQYQVQS